MKPKTKARLVQTGNRIGKSRLAVEAMEVDLPKPRRSIPIKEVDEIIKREVSRVKSERTIYDDRNSLIKRINEVERNYEYHSTCLHNHEKDLISLRQELNDINTAIMRELDLDSLR